MTPTRTQTLDVPGWADDDWPVFVRSAGPGDGGGTPIVWLHGVPGCSDDWLALLERAGGFAPDLPGFGRSSKRGDGDFTLEGYARFAGAFADAIGAERIRLVVHGWGAAALVWAAANPERIERLVVVDAVPLLPGHRWHRFARLLRMRGVGEVAIGLLTGFVLRRTLPAEVAAGAAAHLDQGTQRAILRLYRSAGEDDLAAHASQLAALKDVSTLVVWGQEDRYVAAKFASTYADALGGATVRVSPVAGHWPWLDDRAVADAIVDFVR